MPQFSLGYNFLSLLQYSTDPKALWPALCSPERHHFLFAVFHDRSGVARLCGGERCGRPCAFANLYNKATNDVMAWFLVLLPASSCVMVFITLLGCYHVCVQSCCRTTIKKKRHHATQSDFERHVIAGRKAILRILEGPANARYRAKKKACPHWVVSSAG